MLSEKYKPKNLDEIVGQKTTIQFIKTWIGNPSKPLLLYGPPGSGKTSMVYALANEEKLDVIEVNASDARNAEMLEKIVLPAVSQKSLFGKGKIILIDEVDGLNYSDKGAIQTLMKIIAKSKYPIVMTANNVWDQKLAPLRQICEKIQLNRVNTLVLEKKISEINDKEDLGLSENDIKVLSRYSGGDMRSVLLDLENFKNLDEIGWRERERNIFETLKIIFKSKTLKSAFDSLKECDKDPEEIFWWIEENITNEFDDPVKRAIAYELISRSDLFRRRIWIKQDYKLMAYMLYLMSAMGSVQGDSKLKFTSYRPPQRFSMLHARKSEKDEETISELAKEMRCSKRKARMELPILKMIL